MRENEIWEADNKEHSKEYINEAPCNIHALIKDMLDKIENLELRISKLETL